MIIKVDNLLKRFGGNTAVNHVSFKVMPEKITAIIGPNGSGKSTLFNLLSGIIPQDEGRVYLQGKDISKKNDFEISRQGLSRTFQEIRVYAYLTVREHFETVVIKNNESFFKNFFVQRQNLDALYQNALEQVGLEISLDMIGMDLSYGQSKLLNLSMSLVKPHQILLLDEPVAGVNPRLRERIKDILIDLRKKKETILLIEHDMNFVKTLADWLIVMDAGKIIIEGTSEEVLKNKEVLRVYLGR